MRTYKHKTYKQLINQIASIKSEKEWLQALWDSVKAYSERAITEKDEQSIYKILQSNIYKFREEK